MACVCDRVPARFAYRLPYMQRNLYARCFCSGVSAYRFSIVVFIPSHTLAHAHDRGEYKNVLKINVRFMVL